MTPTTVLKGALARVRNDDVPSLAAGVAFKIFLSLFPALLAAVAVFSYVVDPLQVARELRFVLPPGLINDVLQQRLEGLAEESGTAAVALVVGVLGGLWAATSAAATLIKALNRINGVTDTRGFLAQRLVALLVTLGLLLVLAVVAAAIILEGPLKSLFDWALDGELGMAGSALVTVAQGVVALLLLIGLFAFVYRVGPNRQGRPRRWISAGAVVGVVGWLVLSLAFRAFVQTLGTYEQTYGSLAAVAITLLWLQLSMMMLLLGAEIDVEVGRGRETAEALAEGAGMAPPSGAARLTADAGGVAIDAGDAAQAPASAAGADAGGVRVVGEGLSGPGSAPRPRTVAAAAGLGALGLAVVLGLRGRR